MIGYYLSTGDPKISEIFTPYVWGSFGLGKLIDKSIRNKDYGQDIKLLLIQYYVEGEFSRYLPEEPKVGNYSKKNRDIAVAIGVPSELFHDRSEFERREFIVDSTLNAIHRVKSRLEKKKLNIDFDLLLTDMKEIVDAYLKHDKPYSQT